jgi:hypothetical protein
VQLAKVALTHLARTHSSMAIPAAAPIAHLVSVEVIEGFVSTVRNWTAVAVIWIEAFVHVAIEVVGAMGTKGRLR